MYVPDSPSLLDLIGPYNLNLMRSLMSRVGCTLDL